MIYHTIAYSTSYYEISWLDDKLCQVKAKEKEIKHKLCPHNEFLHAKDLDPLHPPAVCPREELHQFLLCLYGEYVLLSSFAHVHTQVLCAPELYKSPDCQLVSDAMLRRIWTRLRDRLSSLGSFSSMVEVTTAYATHFIDM